MISDDLMLHDDYEDFAKYLGVDYEDYVELLSEFEVPDYDLEVDYSLSL